jgi:hypothetical protein
MSGQDGERWLRFYPRSWRERYGDEMRELILATSGPGPLPWRVRLDLLRGGLRERMRSFGFGGAGIPPARRARAGVLLVLCAWALMIVGGALVQRYSENWRQFTPPADQGLPGEAYDTLIGAAVLAGLLVLAGIAITLPRFVGMMRSGGWRELRPECTRALESTVLAVIATFALGIWSRQLDFAQRNGHDIAYGIGFLLWGVAAVACLVAWTLLAVKSAGRVELPKSLLKAHSALAGAVAACMLLASAACAVWWAALAGVAPWALSDNPVGAGAAVVGPQLLLGCGLMAVASSFALGGAAYALRARRVLCD